MNERSKALGAPVLFYGGGMPAGAWGRINPFCKQPLHSKKHAEKKGGKRRAHCRSAGAKGGRPKKAAAADVVLQQPAADLPVKGAAVLGRPPKKQDAAPRVRSALHRRRPRSARRRMPARQPACSGGPFSCPLSFVLSSLTSLFMQQAEQGSRTLRFSMQCLLLEKRAGEQVEQEFVFLNTFFLSKETYGGHMRGSNQSRSTK